MRRTAAARNTRALLVLIEPAIPAYNNAIYEAIAQFEGIDLCVWADLETPSQLNQYARTKPNFKAEHLPTRTIGPFILRPGLLRRLFAARPNIVILNGNPRDLSAVLALVFCRLAGCRAGVWNMFHRIGHPHPWTELYLRLVGQVAHLVMSYGKRGMTEQTRRGTPQHKIIVISTAIDERSVIRARDSIKAEDVTQFKTDEGLCGKKILLHVVRLTPIKRPDLMLQYYASLLKIRSDVFLVWIGGGPLEAEIKALAAKMGIEAHMRFIGPLYDERQLALWYRAASLFVMATCVGLSVHHAMCYGLPVITDDNEFTQASEFEVLQDGINGLTFKSGDADDFVRKVNSVLDSPELRDRLGAAAKRRLEIEYTLARKIENVRSAVNILRSKARFKASASGGASV